MIDLPCGGEIKAFNAKTIRLDYSVSALDEGIDQ